MKLLNIVLLFFGILCFSTAATDFAKTPITEHGEVEVILTVGNNEALGNRLGFRGLYAINIDEDGRIIGIIVGGFENRVDNDRVATFTAKNSSYTYIGDRLKIGEGKEVGKYWSLVAYIRASCLHNDDNEIYYAAPENIMYWKTITSCPVADTAYYQEPFISTRIDIKFKGKNDASPTTVVSHEKCSKTEQCTSTNDWISNHGIYRMYDTRRFTSENKRAVGDESMHLLYYAPIQHIGSYFT